MHLIYFSYIIHITLNTSSYIYWREVVLIKQDNLADIDKGKYYIKHFTFNNVQCKCSALHILTPQKKEVKYTMCICIWFCICIVFCIYIVWYLHTWWMYLDGQACQWNAHFHHLLSSIKEPEIWGRGWKRIGRRRKGYNWCRRLKKTQKKKKKGLSEMWKWLLRWEYANCLEGSIYMPRTLYSAHTQVVHLVHLKDRLYPQWKQFINWTKHTKIDKICTIHKYIIRLLNLSRISRNAIFR